MAHLLSNIGSRTASRTNGLLNTNSDRRVRNQLRLSKCCLRIWPLARTRGWKVHYPPPCVTPRHAAVSSSVAASIRPGEGEATGGVWTGCWMFLAITGSAPLVRPSDVGEGKEDLDGGTKML